MIKTIFLGTLRLARALVFALGVAVALAAILAATALAADGKPFLLGKNNVAAAVSKLVKSGAGPALELRVGSGPPLKVNSDAQVANLNADELDGKDSGAFLPNNLYTAAIVAPGTSNRVSSDSAYCALGDVAVSGGFSDVEEDTVVLESYRRPGSPTGQEGWRVEWKNPSVADSVFVEVTCIDVT